ncbi:mRNA interferase RelE/StbE [Streptomyces sp. 1331.2]|nr:mRNA interferase RelE/StbE [Streptomyces sp. 1331.2]
MYTWSIACAWAHDAAVARGVDPLGFNTTALVSQPERRRLRMGDYRVVCTIDDGQLVVWIVHVGPRSTTYTT